MQLIRFMQTLILAALIVGGCVCSAIAAGSPPSAIARETMLMFVGEADPVVTVASRTPELPTAAPAMVTVVDRAQIARRGYQTLAEVLSDQPGFFMAPGGRRATPYLRGLPNSVLFLYDGVPLTTDVTKSFAPLGREISLAAIERIEIVRGPGSVLWGPDAFAGVVNVVPLHGQDRPGGETGFIAGSDDLLGGHLNFGYARHSWDAFLSLSGVRERFHEPDYITLRDGGPDGSPVIDDEEVDASGFLELVGTLRYDDWLQVSGRWSDFSRNFTLRNETQTLIWDGEKETPVNQIKVTASQVVGPSHYSLSAFYQETDYRVRDADIERQQKNEVTHVELLWDRRIFARGLVTAGVSWRRNAVDGALVRDGFLPDFLSPQGSLFVPTVEQENFVNTLRSAFTQFRYKWGDTEFWLGGRVDDHSQYDSHLSYSLGFYRPLGDRYHLKATYGTAFRSPYSSQLFDNRDFDPELIRTASAQVSWQPGDDRFLELTAFHSRLKDHRSEDPYGGLSLPVDREIYGIELGGRIPLLRHVSLEGNASWFDGSDDQEEFRVLAFSFLRPDGTEVPVFDEWNEPFDTGPNWVANLGLSWDLAEDHNLRLDARTAGDIDYSFNKGTVEGSYSYPVLVDLVYRRPGFRRGHDTVTLRLTNLLDEDYSLPDAFGPLPGPPLQASILWRYRF